MSNPSPEPSAESLAEARELWSLWSGVPNAGPSSERLIDSVALALDAAKRSSRREALGQAAKLAENARVIHFAETMGENEASRTAQRLAAALRALMEAE